MKKVQLTFLFFMIAFISSAQSKLPAAVTSFDSISPAIHIPRESRFVINIHKAYSVGLGSTFNFYPDDISSVSIMQNGFNLPTRTIKYSGSSKGLGDGVKVGFGVSYVLNDFINIGIDFDYFNSTIKKNRDSSFTQINPTTRDEYSYTANNTISYQAELLTLTPNITFKAITKSKWFLYNKLGAIVTFRPNSLQRDVTTSTTTTGKQGVYKDSFSTVSKVYDWSIRNPAYGFMAAFGTQVKLGKKLRGFAELQFSHIVFVIRKRTLTDFVVDNRSVENTVPVNEREVIFLRSFTTNYITGDQNRPSQTITQRIPITYLGLQAGLAWPL